MDNEFDYYSHSLAAWIETNIKTPDPKQISSIRSLWNDNYSWEDIVEKLNTEGSAWVVWWEDGVRAYYRIDN